MKNLLVSAMIVMSLAACTPRTILQNPETKQVADCSGSGSAWMVGGLIAMNIEHNKCVEQYRALGFKGVGEQ